MKINNTRLDNGVIFQYENGFVEKNIIVPNYEHTKLV